MEGAIGAGGQRQAGGRPGGTEPGLPPAGRRVEPLGKGRTHGRDRSVRRTAELEVPALPTTDRFDNRARAIERRPLRTAGSGPTWRTASDQDQRSHHPGPPIEGLSAIRSHHPKGCGTSSRFAFGGAESQFFPPRRSALTHFCVGQSRFRRRVAWAPGTATAHKRASPRRSGRGLETGRRRFATTRAPARSAYRATRRRPAARTAPRRLPLERRPRARA